ALGLHRVTTTARYLTLDELDELADAVRLVHDKVAGLQLQRVHHVLAAHRELLDLPRVVPGGATVELALTQHGQLQFRQLKTVFYGCLEQVGDAGLGIRRQFFDHAGGVALVGERLGGALDQASALGDDHHTPAVLQQVADVVDRAIRLPLKARHGARLDADVVLAVTEFARGRGLDTLAGARYSTHGIVRRSTTVEAAEGPPGARAGGVAQLLESEEVAGVEVDRRLGSDRGRIPGGGEKLAVRFDETHGPAR